MAKRTQNKKSALRLEALEQRQLLAGVTGAGTEVGSNIQHPNGNVYDQVLLTGGSVTVTADAGQITRISFLDAQGDIVQAEFGGSGSLTVSMGDGYTTGVAPDKYNQTGVTYVQGLASFTITGSDATTNFSVFSVGSNNAINKALFDSTHTGGDHYANVQRLTIVANPENPNGSVFGGIFAGNAVFTGSTGVVGITAANVQVQQDVRIADIDASGTATPTLVFGTASQFGGVLVAGGDLVQTNGKTINNSDSYNYSITLGDGQLSDGTVDTKESISGSVTFSDNDPFGAQNKTFTLTAGVDTFTGGVGNDLFNATVTDVSAFDNLAGGDGTDTLNIVNTTATLNVDTSTATAITGIELVNAASSMNAVTLNLSAMTGLQTVTLNNTAATATTLTTKANATSASISTAGTTVTVTDSGGASADKLATVTVNGGTGAIAVSSDVLTNLKLSSNTGDATVTAAAGTRALTINTNATTGKLEDLTATTVTVSNSGSASVIPELKVNAATAVTLTASGADLTITDLEESAGTDLKTINITGDKAVTVAGLTGTGLTTVNASGSSGTVTFTPSLGTAITYTGGSGKDVITVGATTKAITTGDGDDSITLTAQPLGSGGSIDAGGGTDTLTTTSAIAVAASASATFEGTVSNIDRLALSDAPAASATVNLANLDDINWVSSVGVGDADAATDTLTISNYGANGTLHITGASAEVADGYAVTLASAGGSSDVFNVSIAGDGLNVGAVSVASVETVNFVGDDVDATADGDTNTVALTAAAAKTINVTGDQGLNLAFTTGTAVTTFDASAVTSGPVTWTSGALAAAATVKGGAGDDTFVLSAATKASTVTLGDGANSVTIANTQANSVTGGKDNDTITVGGGNNTITTGDGVNTVTIGNGNNSVTGGAGVDTVIIGSGTNTISLGGGDDIARLAVASMGLTTIDLGAGTDTVEVDAVPTAAGFYPSVIGAAAGDIIDFSAVDDGGGTTADTDLGTKITLGGAASFANYLDAAAQGDGATASSIVKWFQFQGNTYVVLDNSAAATFQDGVDVVVELQGSVDLSTSDVTAAGVLTI